MVSDSFAHLFPGDPAQNKFNQLFAMDSKEFLELGNAAIEFAANYWDNIRDRKVLPNVSPGYLLDLIPENAPEKSEPWQKVFEDIEKVIMPGSTHWLSPYFFAYYPSVCNFPSIVAEMMSAGIATMTYDWQTGPACTELESIVMDWMAKLLGLPEYFLNSSEGPGGGVLQVSASVTTYTILLAARDRAVHHYLKLYPHMNERTIKSKLVAYSSDQSNSSVERAGMLASIPMRLLPTSEESCTLSPEVLEEAIKKDREAGLLPCYVVATLGTTGTCAFDNLEDLAPICQRENLWLHVDAAYAGTAFCCPEFRYLMKGIELVDSFNFNPHKWMMINFDSSAMWVKDSTYLEDTYRVNKNHLADETEDMLSEYSNWQIPNGRRFRSLKVWFVLRSYGAEGIRKHVRNHVRLAKYFETLVVADERFDIASATTMGVVCFKARAGDHVTQGLLDKLSERKNIYVIPATWKGKLIIRFVMCSPLLEKKDLDIAWKEITSQIEIVLNELSETKDIYFKSRAIERL